MQVINDISQLATEIRALRADMLKLIQAMDEGKKAIRENTLALKASSSKMK